MDHARGNGRPRKITGSTSKAIGQSIRRNDGISTRTLAKKVCKMGVEVSHMTISRHLAAHGYSNALPLGTPMLTDVHKQSAFSGHANTLTTIGATPCFPTKQRSSFIGTLSDVGTKVCGQFVPCQRTVQKFLRGADFL